MHPNPKKCRSAARALCLLCLAGAGIGFTVVGGQEARVAQPTTSPSTRPADVDPRALLQEVARRYAALPAYEDEGRAVVRFLDADGQVERLNVKAFRTRFERGAGGGRGGPSRYFFEFRDAPPTMPVKEDTAWDAFPKRYVVWRAAPNEPVRTWWSVQPGQTEEADFSMALAGATGVSAGTALNIPGLLAPDAIDATRLTDLEQPRLTGTAEHDGRRCHVVAGTSMGDPTELWIDVEDKLIRKIVSRHAFEDFSTQDTIVYSPKLGPAFDAKSFAFRPPR